QPAHHYAATPTHPPEHSTKDSPTRTPTTQTSAPHPRPHPPNTQQRPTPDRHPPPRSRAPSDITSTGIVLPTGDGDITSGLLVRLLIHTQRLSQRQREPPVEISLSLDVLSTRFERLASNIVEAH